MARTFRQLFRHLTPSWLHTGEGELVLHTLALMKDAFTERVLLGLEARFPSRAGPSANALTGKDRGIIRGRDETNEHYAQRLIAWRYPRGHRVRGSAFAALEQISEYFGGIRCWSIDVKGNRHTREVDGTESYSYSNAWDWDGTGSTPNWARFWFVLESVPGAAPTPDFGDPELWGGELGTPGYAIGQVGVSPDDAAALCGLFTGKRPWKPAGTRAEWILLKLNAAASDPAPDGTWLHWSQNVAGRQTAKRDGNYRYWSLNPTVNNTYAGDPDNFPDDTEMPGGTPYAGDPDSFPTSVTLPSGKVYAGNPNNFPASVLLLDDGGPAA